MNIARTLAAATLAFVVAAPVSAQRVTFTPKASAYVAAADFSEVSAAFRGAREAREAHLALGLAAELNLPVSPLDVRVGVDYLTGMTVTPDSTSGEVEPAEGSALFLSGDLVYRPLPRLIIFQPYFLGGFGFKQESFSRADGFDSALPENSNHFLMHAGFGVDAMLGRIGVVAEVSDFFGKPANGGLDTGTQHDAFASIGVRFGLF